MFFLVLATILALVSLPTPFASQGANTTFPINFPIRIINTAHQASCPPDEEREMARDETAQDIRNSIRNTVIPTLCGQTQASPVASCSALPTFCSSGYHWVTSSNGTAVQVYCDMDRVCGCSSTGGWTRVAHLNMSNPSEQCPGEWTLQTYSSEPRRLCGGVRSGTGCASAMYSTYGINYSHVCGRVIGYEFGAPDAFSPAIENPSVTIDGNYVDGVSLTHGSPGGRQHIWTFAAGFLETVRSAHQNQIPPVYCPCVNGTVTPSFVGNDYFCESGNPGPTFLRELHPCK